MFSTSFVCGTATDTLRASLAFLMRVMRFEIGSVTMVVIEKCSRLPRRLLDTWDNTLVGKLTETDTAEIEVSHVAVFAATAETTSNDARFEFRLFLGSYDN